MQNEVPKTRQNILPEKKILLNSPKNAEWTLLLIADKEGYRHGVTNRTLTMKVQLILPVGIEQQSNAQYLLLSLEDK